MKQGVYGILKAKFLIDDDAIKNWRFIVFLILLAIIMIANTQRYEQKVFQIAQLTSEVKELRSEFVDRRSQLMKLKMESTVSAKMIEKGIFPATVPPVKIKVKKVEETSFLKKLWQ
ncbi:FtsL-like putative cell division protein [Flavobacterium muglaense]|uniref:S-adenosyl-methyltransferase n=1 Tax=Flavobacterium muglaense TaxID=2764716 RepID=A0A923SE18_9FLAO|nr:FtsL-like putative cell division protein [Flavobacterium muglaense]MBC5836496.1 S-adenosyl-methyltransferase [Flavobacterium muglaense]MBC5843026.1 S-adenosyl-methyltransferase [Flavobacterium muglaense]